MAGEPVKPPGFNPLFYGVSIAVLIGVAAALRAGEATLLHSNLLFRFAVGGGVAAIGYAVVAALWLAWHRRLFKKINVAGTGVDTGGQATELTERDREIAEFMGATTNAVDELRRRMEALERPPN